MGLFRYAMLLAVLLGVSGCTSPLFPPSNGTPSQAATAQAPVEPSSVKFQGDIPAGAGVQNPAFAPCDGTTLTAANTGTAPRLEIPRNSTSFDVQLAANFTGTPGRLRLCAYVDDKLTDTATGVPPLTLTHGLSKGAHTLVLLVLPANDPATAFAGASFDGWATFR